MNYVCPWESSIDLILPWSSFVLSTLQEQGSDEHGIPEAALAAHAIHFYTYCFFFLYPIPPTTTTTLGKKHVVPPKVQISFGHGLWWHPDVTLCPQNIQYPSKSPMQSTTTDSAFPQGCQTTNLRHSSFFLLNCPCKSQIFRAFYSQLISWELLDIALHWARCPRLCREIVIVKTH